jgi:hypothetical protein
MNFEEGLKFLDAVVGLTQNQENVVDSECPDF